MTDTAGGSADAARLAAALLDAEAERRTVPIDGAGADAPDAALPGVGGADVSLRTALRKEGARTAVVVGLLGFVSDFDNTAVSVLAPDIRRSLGMSQGAIVVLGVMSTAMFLLGAAPVSTLADRKPRTNVLVWCVAGWAAVVACTPFVVNSFQFFVTRLGGGLGHSYQLPVTGPILIDRYPIEARSRIFAFTGALTMVGTASAPLFAGGVAALAGGDDGWRWVFAATALLAIPLVFLATTVPEPQRGRHEMRSVLGDELAEGDDELPISLSVAFERLRKIRSFYYFLIGMAALGFALVRRPAVPEPLLRRGTRPDGIGARPRRIAHRSSRPSPPSPSPAAAPMRCSARARRARWPHRRVASSPFGTVLPSACGCRHCGRSCRSSRWRPRASRAAFMILPAAVVDDHPLSPAVPGHGAVGIYVLLVGGLRRRVLASLRDACGERPALTAILLPASLIGGFLISLGARHIRARHGDGRRGAARESRRSGPACSSPTPIVPVLQVATSTSPTARCRCCSTSTSRCTGARRSRCSARTARASRRCCA